MYDFSLQHARLSHKFTGKERDSESGNDNFKARYLGSSLGRFLSPDDLLFGDPDVTNPQSWNLYAYVRNNPLNAVDPDGHTCVQDPDTGQFVDNNDGGETCAEAEDPSQAQPPSAIVTAALLPADLDALFGTSDPDPGPTGISSNDPLNRLTNAQNAAINNPAFAPGAGGATHCNQAVCAVAKTMGAPMGPLTDAKKNPLLAEQIRANLAKPNSGYHEVDTVTAVQLANLGVLVIGVGPGHVFTLSPGGTPGGTPLAANVGAQNGVLSLNYVFTRADLASVRYYTPN